MPTLKIRLDNLNDMVAAKLNKVNDLAEKKSNKLQSLTTGVSDPVREFPSIAAVNEGLTSYLTDAKQYTDDEIDTLVTFLANNYINQNQKGVANGVATLGPDSRVPASQMPSYVDDVIEVADFASLPASGEAGKIYVTLNDNLTYRWSGTAYAEISKSLAIGIITGTAFDGKRGKDLEDAMSAAQGNISALESEFNTHYKAMGGTDFPDYSANLNTATPNIPVV